MKMVNGQPRYIVTIPSWRMNGKRLFPDEDILDVVIVNETASRLRVRFDPANFTGDPVSFTCFLPLTGGGEDSASRVVDPQGNYICTLFMHALINATEHMWNSTMNVSVVLNWAHL